MQVLDQAVTRCCVATRSLIATSSEGISLHCRFFGILIYEHLYNDYGYKWMMRMDEDSFIHSPVTYSMFQFMDKR